MHIIQSFERNLLVKLKEGDEPAFSAIYEMYVKNLFVFVQNILKSPAIAEDVVQEVFIKLWETAPRINTETSIKPYLFTIARNLSLNVIRNASKEHWITDEIAQYAFDTHENGFAFTQYRQTKDMVNTAISQLPPQRKKIYELCRGEGYTYKQAANELGVTDSTVNSQMVKAIKSIKQYLIKNGALLFL